MFHLLLGLFPIFGIILLPILPFIAPLMDPLNAMLNNFSDFINNLAAIIAEL